MGIDEYFGDWSRVIDLNEADRLMKRLSSQRICPLPKDIFRAFRLCSPKDVRCIIIGMDPYNNLRNGKPVATGLAFAIPQTLQRNPVPHP